MTSPLPLLLLLLAAAPAVDGAPAPPEISAAALSAHVRFLASDLLEGRLPGTRGDRLAQAYIAARFEALGLEPAAPGGGWFQQVPLVGITSRLDGPLRLQGAGGALALQPGDELVAVAGAQRERAEWKAAELVFVGYGIDEPAHGRDDWKGVDVRGKVVLVMNDNPPLPGQAEGVRARRYVGRWTYKFEEAARRGAAGALLIHTTPSAAYPWKVVRTSWSGEQFAVPDGETPRLGIQGWLTEDAARRLVALGGGSLDALREAAERSDFRPVALGVRASLGVQATLSRTESANVLARLPGSDPARSREAVIYTAHHDHLGTIPGAVPGADAIYNGAVDNATGVAALLELAAAFSAQSPHPARSILFAAVAAEEQGTVGSRWLAGHSPIPVGRLAAVINLDSMNVFGRTRDVVVVGLGRSSLDPLVEAAAARQGRSVRPDPHPERGGYYRSDHFPLAQAGVPGVYLGGGSDFVGRAPGWGEATRTAWGLAHYHQPSDEWHDQYDLSGMVEDVQLAWLLGLSVAARTELPSWRPGDEFEPARRAALEAARRAP